MFIKQTVNYLNIDVVKQKPKTISLDLLNQFFGNNCKASAFKVAS